MSVVTVSPRFQVVIPRRIREALGIVPGQKVRAIQYENRVEFIPVRTAKQMRGSLIGLDTRVTRERDRLLTSFLRAAASRRTLRRSSW